MTDYLLNPRRAPRATFRCRVRVQVGSSAWDAETEDIGPNGCQLVAPVPLQRGAAVQLELAAPGVGRPLVVKGRAAWVSSQAPWRLGVAFDEGARPQASRWFEQVVASRPGLGAFRRVPDRLPIDAMLYLAPPPRFADFSPAEVRVLREVGAGITVAELRRRLWGGWSEAERALFSLLMRGAVTVAPAAAVRPEAWRQVMAELGTSFAPPPEPPLHSPPPAAPYDPPPAPPPASISPPPPGPAQAERAPPPAPPQGGDPLTAGTGWRGAARTRSADAQEAFDLGRQELAAGRTKAAMALLRRAMQLAPGDAEVAEELGRAMKG